MKYSIRLSELMLEYEHIPREDLLFLSTSKALESGFGLIQDVASVRYFYKDTGICCISHGFISLGFHLLCFYMKNPLSDVSKVLSSSVIKF